MLARRLLDLAPDAMVLVNTEGRIVQVNALVESMFGYARDELLGRPLEILIPPRYRQKHGAHLAHYLEEPRARPMGTDIEIWAMRKDGSEFPAEISLGPMESEEGLLVLSAHRDITERRRMEQVIREKDAQLFAAQRIQERLLPESPPSLSGFDIFGACFPAQFAAGDHFDYLAMPDNCLGIAVGDVTGHGIGSALVMAAVHALLRALAQITGGVEEILQRTNCYLVDGTDPDMFVTLFFAHINPQLMILRYVSAGHPTACILDSLGNVKASLPSTSLPLGIFGDTQFRLSDPISLEPGDIALLFTDGLMDAESPEGERFGENRMAEVARARLDRGSREIVESLHQAVQEFSGGNGLEDDLTIVVVKVH